MDQAFTAILLKLVAEQGKEALLNSAKCKSFLADYTRREYQRESRLILHALEAGSVQAIDSAADLDFCKQQQAQRLQEEYFLVEEIARDVVDTLALALRGNASRMEPPGDSARKEIVDPPLSAPLRDGSMVYPLEGFALVEGGTFQMGSNNGEANEKPVHSVTVKSFYIGKYEVTQKEWMAVMGTTVRQQADIVDKSWPMAGEGDNYPMYYVSWNEVLEYCNRRSQEEGLTQAYRSTNGVIVCDFTANGYRLPTEAEWEFAVKGGNRDLMEYTYSGSNSVGAVAWYDGNSGRSTHPVGTKAPNSLGIYDMSGNVWEWCWDWYGGYSSGAQTDPMGASSGSYRVNRGGSWAYAAQFVRSAGRNDYTPTSRYSNLGFRLARSWLKG